jgi:hypothetical protein
MKNFLLGLVILNLLMVSCTADSIVTAENIDNTIIGEKSKQKTARLVQNQTPENPANNYDFAGKIHNEILDVYLAGNYQHYTIAQISQQIELIAAQNNNLTSLNVGTNLPTNVVFIQEVINNPQTELDHTIANSAMTVAAKNNLSDFMNEILLWENHSYEEIYESIIAYESTVIANPAFTSEDKRIILTTSSIVRYSTYYDLERKDKEWDDSTGHRVGAISGAVDNSVVAIIRSLVTGIMIHNQTTE